MHVHKHSVIFCALMVCVLIIETPVFSRYKLALLKPCQKAVNQSTKISIRMDQRGFLSLQCMILTTDKQICFVEYLVRILRIIIVTLIISYSLRYIP